MIDLNMTQTCRLSLP